MYAGLANVSTPRIARVREVIALSIFFGSMFSVFGQMSTNTGLAPTIRITLLLAMKLNGVVITSSPGLIPSASSDRCSPDVPEFTATPYRRSHRFATSFSNCSTIGPIDSRPDRSDCTTRSISTSVMSGRDSGISCGSCGWVGMPALSARCGASGHAPCDRARVQVRAPHPARRPLRIACVSTRTTAPTVAASPTGANSSGASAAICLLSR